MTTKYWYKNCPRCNQGRLFVMIRKGYAQPYLHCEECEWSWDDRSKVSETAAGRIGINYENEYATLANCTENEWNQDELVPADD